LPFVRFSCSEKSASPAKKLGRALCGAEPIFGLRRIDIILKTGSVYDMVSVMSRDSLQTVTMPLPVLVDAEMSERKEDSVGTGTFFSPDQMTKGKFWVRVVKESDIKSRLRAIFKPLEDLRNAISPIRVLHEAVRLAGIADTGPILPLMTNLEEAEHGIVRAAARELLRKADTTVGAA